MWKSSKIGFLKSPWKMVQVPCGCPPARPGGVQERRKKSCWSVCASRIPSRVPHALGKDLARGWLFLKVPMWEQVHHALGQFCESCTLPTRFITGRQCTKSAVQMHVPISLQRGDMQLGCGVLPGALNPLWGEACRWAPARQRELVPPSLAPSPPAFSTTLKIRSCHTITIARWSALLSWTQK